MRTLFATVAICVAATLATGASAAEIKFCKLEQGQKVILAGPGESVKVGTAGISGEIVFSILARGNWIVLHSDKISLVDLRIFVDESVDESTEYWVGCMN